MVVVVSLPPAINTFLSIVELHSILLILRNYSKNIGYYNDFSLQYIAGNGKYWPILVQPRNSVFLRYLFTDHNEVVKSVRCVQVLPVFRVLVAFEKNFLAFVIIKYSRKVLLFYFIGLERVKRAISNCHGLQCPLNYFYIHTYA